MGTKTKAELDAIKVEQETTKKQIKHQNLHFGTDKTAMLTRVDLIKTFMVERHNTITVDLAHQTTKFPVFKDVSGLWRFDYAAAEQKRFRGTEMWDPNRLPEELVDQYL